MTVHVLVLRLEPLHRFHILFCVQGDIDKRDGRGLCSRGDYSTITVFGGV